MTLTSFPVSTNAFAVMPLMLTLVIFVSPTNLGPFSPVFVSGPLMRAPNLLNSLHGCPWDSLWQNVRFRYICDRHL